MLEFVNSRYKSIYYFSDIRVPLLVRGPGVESNKVIDDVVVNVDLAPTILDMAGQAMPLADGVSFLPALLQNEHPREFIESNDINSNYLPGLIGTVLHF